jgi:hypothetical protein
MTVLPELVSGCRRRLSFSFIDSTFLLQKPWARQQAIDTQAASHEHLAAFLPLSALSFSVCW